MLAAENRLTGAEDFRRTVRSGVRAGADLLVVHWAPEAGGPTDERPVRAGFIVSKAVGNAVARNRVKRRLRHLTREQLSALPGPGVLVVRALPPAAQCSGDELRAQLQGCLARAVRRSAAGTSRKSP